MWCWYCLTTITSCCMIGRDLSMKLVRFTLPLKTEDLHIQMFSCSPNHEAALQILQFLTLSLIGY